jgi:uncharacterized protein YjbI with pentapeptide repeats
MMADKLDPFDIEALESAVNDSATRVSTIWISFLIFSLYLLITATTVTQRQLLLAEPVKLPVLNIDLPLWGFFFLAPILFVILHAYVLLQVVLLGRTAAAYNTAVARVGLSPEENNSLRQRLANTLFAQIFAGSPRESEGWLGWLLNAMAWITLAMAPILILLAFQFSFLAYHSHIVTWTHRLLILFELAALFLIWPLAFDAQKDFQWPKVGAGLKRTAALTWRLFGPREQRHEEQLWLRQQAAPLAACLLFIIVSLSIATFPGEPHVNLFTLKPLLSVQCDRWFQQKFERVDLRFDRLDLPQIDVVDNDGLAKIVKHSSELKQLPSEGERTQDFRARDFDCSDLSSADLRRVDLTDARLVGAKLSGVALDGASLDRAQLDHAYLFLAQLRRASLDHAQLQGADLSFARLQGADLTGARLQGADLGSAWLQGADLEGALLQGASLKFAHFQGASFDTAQLQGASLNEAELQGASLYSAQLQGASLDSARLQGASLDSAQLQGASLNEAELQGADLLDAILDHSVFSNVWTWRAIIRIEACTMSRVTGHKPDIVIDVKRTSYDKNEPIPATPDATTKFVDNSIAEIPDASQKDRVAQMRQRLLVEPPKGYTEAVAKVWSDCEAVTSKIPREKFDEERAALLRNIVCDATDDRQAIGIGIINNWVSYRDDKHLGLSVQIARSLLGQDGRDCAATRDFDEATMAKLHAAAARTVPAAAPAK